VKERLRANANSLPFRKYPPKLIAELVYNVIFCSNGFPHRDGVHVTISSITLLTGLAMITICTVRLLSAHKYRRMNMGTIH